MNKVVSILFLYLLVFCSQIALAEELENNNQEKDVLRLGLLPYLSPKMLYQKWRPLAKHLEKTLSRQVVMVSAPDFSSYAQRAQTGKYDIYMTAPHFAVRDVKAGTGTVLMRFASELQGDIVVAKQSTITDIKDLKNMIFATPDKLAIITIVGEELLKKNGLKISENIKVNHFPSHNTVLLAVADGRAQGGIAIGGLLSSMPPKIKNKLRILNKSEMYPHAMIVGYNRVSKEEISKIKTSIFEFVKDRQHSNDFIQNLGFGTLVPVDSRDINRLENILPLLNSRMK